MDENYGGYDFNIERESDKVTANVKIDYSIVNLEQLIIDQPTMKEAIDSDGNLTLSGIKGLYKSLGITCKD